MRVTQVWGISVVVMFCVLISLVGVSAIGLDINDSCYVNTPAVTIFFSGNQSLNDLQGFGIQNNCVGGTSVQWVQPVNLSVLGNIVTNDVVISDTFVYVDSSARPDLDVPATIVFRDVPFAVEPGVARDGHVCSDCQISYDAVDRSLTVNVSGFSNYSLTARQDFTVYSDQQPELADKVYQTIDLGDSYRATDFSCIVQIFGLNPQGQYVLLQTDPQRQVQAKLLGNPDTQQPESLGYFPTKNGVANVYFLGNVQPLAGYEDFEYVAQCSSSTQKLVYEEPISTRYPQFGRSMTGRAIWLAQDSNAFFLVIAAVVVFIGMFLVVKVLKAWFA